MSENDKVLLTILDKYKCVIAVKKSEAIQKELEYAKSVSDIDNKDIETNFRKFYITLCNEIDENHDLSFIVKYEDGYREKYDRDYHFASIGSNAKNILLLLDKPGIFNPINISKKEFNQNEYYTMYEKVINSFINIMKKIHFQIIYDPFADSEAFNFLLDNKDLLLYNWENYWESLAGHGNVNALLETSYSRDYKDYEDSSITNLKELKDTLRMTYYNDYLKNGDLYLKQEGLLRLSSKYGM